MFMFSDVAPVPRTAASPSVKGNSQTPVVDLSKTPPRTSATVVHEVEDTEDSAAIPVPQPVEVSQAIPAGTLVPSVDDQPSTANIQPLHSNPGTLATPQVSEAVAFVSPQEVFGPLKPVGFAKIDAAVVSAVVVQSPSSTPPTILASSQPVISRQVTASSILSEVSTPVPPPVFDSPQEVTSPQAVIPVVSESPLVTPSQISQAVVPHQVTVFPLIPEIPYLTSFHVPGSAQTISPLQVTGPPAAHEPSTAPDPPQPIQAPQPVHTHPPSSRAEGVTGGSSATVAPDRGVYKTRAQMNGTAASRSRRDSIEGAPDVILTLGESGCVYELVTPSGQPDVSIAPSPTTSTAPSPTTSTTPLDELIIPSSQQSLEEVLTIPMDGVTGLSNTSPAGESAAASLQKSPEESLVSTKRVNHFLFAPRVIPSYQIDRSDFPSWLHERGRLDAVLSVEGGGLWEKLITTWLRQERRLGFGLDDKIVSGQSLYAFLISSNVFFFFLFFFIGNEFIDEGKARNLERLLQVAS